MKFNNLRIAVGNQQAQRHAAEELQKYIAKEYKIDRGVVDDIKFWRRSYAFLQEKFEGESRSKLAGLIKQNLVHI